MTGRWSVPSAGSSCFLSLCRTIIREPYSGSQRIVWSSVRTLSEDVMANSTLQNLKDSAFVRTDPQLSVRIGKYILDLPREPFTVYDPTSGEGDFFCACAHPPSARY